MLSVIDFLPRLAEVKYAESFVSRPSRVLHPGRAEGARIVARLRPLDLDDLGAEVGEVLPGPGTGEHARKIENTDVRQRTHELRFR